MTVAGSQRAYQVVFLLVIGFILYGSLYPFEFHARPGAAAYLISTRGDWDHRGDLLSNILLYMPFGFFGVCAFGRRAAIAVVLGGAALAVGMELAQFYDHGRVTSMGDVYADAIGSGVGVAVAVVVGAGVRWPLLRELRDDPAAALLLLMWFGYRLYPYVPVSSLHKYTHAVASVVSGSGVQPIELARFVIAWMALGAVLDALYGLRRGLLLRALLMLAEFLGRILIIDASLQLADILGAGLALAVWLLVLRRMGEGRSVAVTIAFVGMIVIARLEPFAFSARAHEFGWVPFASFMRGSIGVAMQAFCEKFFQYGGLIWLLRRLGMRIGFATVLTAVLLLGTSWVETYEPGRRAEITDAAMALVIGGVFALLGEGSRRPS